MGAVFIILFFVGFYAFPLTLTILTVESALKKFLPHRPNKQNIFLRSVVRGFSYSPAMIGFGHGVMVFPTPIALIFTIFADESFFGFGIPVSILTGIMFACSLRRRRKEP
jgi:hypothetical protein